MSTHASAPRWLKSSYSGNNDQGMCVEAAGLSGGVGVRDSKDVARGHLAVRLPSWIGLIEVIKAR